MKRALDTTDENVPEADDNQPDNTLPEPPDGAEPCPVGQITNPQTGECEISTTRALSRGTDN